MHSFHTIQHVKLHINLLFYLLTTDWSDLAKTSKFKECLLFGSDGWTSTLKNMPMRFWHRLRHTISLVYHHFTSTAWWMHNLIAFITHTYAIEVICIYTPRTCMPKNYISNSLAYFYFQPHIACCLAYTKPQSLIFTEIYNLYSLSPSLFLFAST